MTTALHRASPDTGWTRGRARVIGIRTVRIRVDLRSVAVGVVLLLAVAAVGAVTLSTGDFTVPLTKVARAVLGSGDPGTDFIVRTLRMPRWLTGICVGAALGIGGGLFQSLSRNPLGSPDVIGFTTGATSGALVVILAFHAGAAQASVGALIGGVGTALLVYLLAIKRGVHGTRLVLVGIGIAAVLAALNDYLITRAKVADAQSASVWILGSLNGRGWDDLRPVALALVVLIAPSLWLARDLRMLELGDDTGRALGVSGERTRLLAVVVGVGLTAISAASAGPIAFVALAAPQIARRLTGVPGPNVVPAALVGALIVSVSDIVAQHLVDTELPVGVVTGAVGGVYLAWMLSREWRKGRG